MKVELKRYAAGKGLPERASILKYPASALAPTNLSHNTEHKEEENVEMSGLINTRFCTTSENVVSVLGSMVGDT